MAPLTTEYDVIFISNCLFSYTALIMLNVNVICLLIWSLFIFLSIADGIWQVLHRIRDWLLLNGPTG
jgi:hypothetical protein